MVTFKTLNNPVDAHLIKVKLESEGIRCVLYQTADPESAEAATATLRGYIAISVHAADLDSAEAALCRSTSIVPKPDLVICPSCKTESRHTIDLREKELRELLASIYTLSTLHYLCASPVSSTHYICEKCGLNYSTAEGGAV